MRFSNYLQKNDRWKKRDERRGRRRKMGERRKHSVGDEMAGTSSPVFGTHSCFLVCGGGWAIGELEAAACPLGSLSDDCPALLSIAAAEECQQHCLLLCRVFLPLLDSCCLQSTRDKDSRDQRTKASSFTVICSLFFNCLSDAAQVRASQKLR